jgi:hypothetical protein
MNILNRISLSLARVRQGKDSNKKEPGVDHKQLTILTLPENKGGDMKKYAILMGISHSPSGPQGRVKVNGDNQVRLMKRILQNAGWGNKNIKMKTNRQATFQNFLNMLNWLEDEEDADSTVVIMFACHGASTGVRLWDQMMPHRYIRDYLAHLKSQKQLIIISTCQSGGALVEGFDGITLCKPNRIVVTSCDERAVDPVTAKYTRWSEAFLYHALKECEADANCDGRVSIQEAAAYTHLVSPYFPGTRIDDQYGQEFYL